MQFLLIVIVAAIVGAVIGAWGFWITVIGGILLAGYCGDIRLDRQDRDPPKRRH